MIYIRLRGRAGNQLFIYALARSLNLKYQQPVTICTRIDDKRDLKFKSFNNDLLEFNISNDIVFDNQFKFPWYANNDFLLVKFFRKLMPSLVFSILARFNVFLWLKESYKEINISTSKDAYIDGFWQSEKYFSDNISQIIHCDFLMKKGIRKENHHFLKEIEENESVCVTIRRGDYLSNESIKRKYYVCDEQYFKKAMKIMKKIIPNEKFVKQITEKTTDGKKSNNLCEDQQDVDRGVCHTGNNSQGNNTEDIVDDCRAEDGVARLSVQLANFLERFNGNADRSSRENNADENILEQFLLRHQSEIAAVVKERHQTKAKNNWYDNAQAGDNHRCLAGFF